ncbi:acylneuraminate cytidylyltransferase [Microbacterium sp. LRZ72]|uniref:acylneuraminate cytidylyltransferase n=1 Tax=Microbacterium sp. LRZ72 TaxID=2942481 RepID=UPI0029AE5D7A|nr:acylneuraminate cytidylyltransferase [Microbacterium sp. LRZ72]MDX2375231.1 acylneuraminate cytidylyltransferase [Microbacterium sp. LRZ72]
MRQVVAVIPARGGSKGVSRKNLRRVGGVPLVGRAVAAARAARTVDRVVVSTDDTEIAAVAREWGAEVIRRPAELSGDTASSESALLHALDEMTENGIRVGTLAFLQATSPFIDPRALDDAVRMITRGPYDSVFSAVETYGFVWERDELGARGINHDAAHRPRRQDRDPHFLETGAFYAMDAAGFRAARHRFFGRTGVLAVPERTAIEIDSEEQLQMARAIAPLVRTTALADTDVIDADAVVTDFDGVHTDDTALVDADGNESVRVSRSDGMGVSLLRSAGVPVLVLSTETNPVVGTRARKLRADVRQAVDDKAAALREWAEARGIPLARIAYVGNDVNDLGCLELVGWPVAVPDAHPLVLAAARAVLTRGGGRGAVRELADRVLRARGAVDVRAADAHREATAPTSSFPIDSRAAHERRATS